MKDALKKLISKHNLAHAEQAILATARTGIRIVHQHSRGDFPGTSRLGGSPDVPPGFVWPVRDGHPLGFLAQINCAEIAPRLPEYAFPESGVLHFFYDMQDEPWGFDPKDRGGAIVLYTPEEPLKPSSPPPDLAPGSILPLILVGFHQFLSIPDHGSCYSPDLPEDDSGAYIKLYDAVMSEAFDGYAQHQLLGRPNNVQGDMPIQCQFASNGIDCGGPKGYKDPRVKKLQAGIADWQLLLQFDTDGDLNIMWGDCGRLYFWIRSEDLQRRDFTQTWTIIQC